MEFFNRKEEVIDIELTSHGRYLLSKGKLKPEYYAFLDNDVLYDTKHAGFQENQKESQDRIRETPRIKAQTLFGGAELRQALASSVINTASDFFEGQLPPDYATMTMDFFNEEYFPELDQAYVHSQGTSMGTSQLSSDKAPSWSIVLNSGEFQETRADYSGSLYPVRIPQLRIDVETRVKAIESGDLDISFDNDSPLGDGASEILAEEAGAQLSTYFDDGSSFLVNSKTIVAEIIERNAPKQKEPFDVEVFRIEKDIFGKEVLQRLKFENDYSMRAEDLAFTQQNVPIASQGLSAMEDERFVSYYINLNLDGEIENTDLLLDNSLNFTSPEVGKANIAPPALGPSQQVTNISLSNIPVNDFVCPDEVDVFETDVSGQSEPAGTTSGGASGGSMETMSSMIATSIGGGSGGGVY